MHASIPRGKMNHVNLLLCRGSPRSNIENVELWNDKQPCDVLCIRYTLEWEAYQQMRRYFLDHPQYTHMVLATDDIVVRPDHIKALQADLEEMNYEVLSGMMNVEQSDTENMNISHKLSTKQRDTRHQVWIKKSDITSKYVHVEFAGFALTAIRRDIIEEYDFPADKIFQGFPPHRGASLDFVFGWWCKEHHIPQIVNSKIIMKHLRQSGTNSVGKKSKLTEFYPSV